MAHETTRRRFLTLAGSAAAMPLLPLPGLAALPDNEPLHGLSAFGSFKYPPGFEQFDYADPGAPSGGTFNFSPPNWAYNQGAQTFDTLNSFTFRGNAPMRMELCFDSLMERALDEPDAIYGLLAESVTISPDRNRYRFRLRDQARFHNGAPVTADDVVFTYMTFKTPEAHPALSQPLRELVRAEAVDPFTVDLVFSGSQSDRTILTAATFPILQKAFFDGMAFDQTRMTALMASGPYRVAEAQAGLFVEYERVPDYWGRDLPVMRGQFHFDRIRIDYYRDRQAGFEAFKKGITLFREEFTSKTWATEYDFPALAEGKVVKRTFDREKFASMQGWAVNRRRPHLADRRMAEAINLCFDFEWTREKLFYGSYERSQSLFTGSDFIAEGPPSDAELRLLEPLREGLPEEVFGDPVTMPVSDGSGRDRRLLSQAARLLGDMGFRRTSEGMLADATGKTLTLEILVRDQTFVRVLQPFIENLRAVGFDAASRMVDASQFETRLRDYDFDMVGIALNHGATPTREGLALIFSAEAAAAPGTRNLPGTADPAVDALLDSVGAAKSREDLTIAMRALDRVLRARRDWIPNWHAANHRTAYWDMFGFDENKPDYGFSPERLWWMDEEKARAIGKA
ncbi:hypothetical protein CSC94_03710 [Zhengella mangrovi]|uniref:Solute-binding protein family 5 domain-containing protein n=1 Tax=Zhengella mangrovi TaxID=1982044 RepID=A0A2G1QUE8_9HYPH|nr:extracellular solute-binding protein [Zhengella mangrovi]PHP69090.1 hypothetical protein CSC94_03710 [Zhengella mangrovi]